MLFSLLVQVFLQVLAVPLQLVLCHIDLHLLLRSSGSLTDVLVPVPSLAVYQSTS